MFKLIGTRKNGHTIDKNYDNKNVALFEFEVTQVVATELKLFENDILIDSYEYIQPEMITYLIEGSSDTHIVNKRILGEKRLALVAFDNEKQKCDWLTLYKEKNNEKQLLEYYVKGA